LVLALTVAGADQARDFPEGFLWGPATSAFQTEAGERPANADRHSDWWAWSHDAENIAAERVSGDRVERSPGHWELFRSDAGLARRRLGANAFRFWIEWSRIFPSSTAAATTPRQLDKLTNRAAVRHYAAELRAIRGRGMTPVLTLNHFTLPSWLHDPIAVREAFRGVGADDPLPAVKRGGWLNDSTVHEFRKFAAWAAWKYGRRARRWVTLNERWWWRSAGT
jgi:beta-galactosidase